MAAGSRGFCRRNPHRRGRCLHPAAVAALLRNEPDEGRHPTAAAIPAIGEEALGSTIQAAAPFELVRGFAVGRTIFAEPARRRLAGEAGDADTVAALAANLRAVVAAWRRARPNPPG